jgi:hypothetical protein
MNVIEAHANLTKLIEEGHGYLELIADDGQGCSSVVSIYAGEPTEVTGREEGGELCEWEEGRKYIPVYTGN